jgi:acylphosphatase
MGSNLQRAEIVVTGLVQGVGFRYFVVRNAQQLGLKGYVKNLYDGSVLTVVEGDRGLIEELFKKLRVGPRSAHVNNSKIEWGEFKNEFSSFEVEY